MINFAVWNSVLAIAIGVGSILLIIMFDSADIMFDSADATAIPNKFPLFSVVFVLILALLIPNIFSTHTEKARTYTERVELISMTNRIDMQSESRFGILGGSLLISVYDTYCYYYESDAGYIDQGRTPVEASHIKYTDEPPFLEIVKTIISKEKTWFFLSDKKSDTTFKYIYHIPEGSVVANYELR